MKKILLLSLLPLKAIACSSEINDVKTIDPTIGIWVHIDEHESKMTVQQNGRIIVANGLKLGNAMEFIHQI